MKNHRLWRMLALVLAFTLVAAACGDDDEGADGSESASASSSESESASSGDEGGGDAVTIEYWLWDGNQEPFYQECANQFTAANPNISVNITQFGWGEYWDGLTAGFATGDVPDVFTDHLARYPEFIDAGVLVPLNDYIDADGTATDIYFPGLADLWVAPDGSRYGLPKDFDTISLVVNGDMAADAGFTADDLTDLDWNPNDGGSFEAAIAAMSVDANGVRGNEDGFDPSNVAVYGYTSNSGYSDAFSQTGWSTFTGSNGWEFLNENPWGDVYNYGDAEFTDVILWWRSLIEKGFMPPSDILAGTGSDTLFGGGQAASMTDGSWKIGTWSNAENGIANAIFAPTPVGPSGQRASMFNGLADSITAASENPDEAWEWVKFLASAECQEIIGAGGVVLPAISSATDLAVSAFGDNGVDISGFTVHVDEGTTFTFPIAGQASEVSRIIGEAIDAVLRGEADASAISAANDEVNALLAG